MIVKYSSFLGTQLKRSYIKLHKAMTNRMRAFDAYSFNRRSSVIWFRI